MDYSKQKVRFLWKDSHWYKNFTRDNNKWQ